MRAERNRYRSLSYYFRLKIGRSAPIVERAAHGIPVQAPSTAAIGDDPGRNGTKSAGARCLHEFPIQMEVS
jgi:hypothetical protein